MVTTAASVEWTVVSTEVEALQLEYSWIKEYDPRFNVKYRDDKSYPYLAVTMNEEFPRVQVMRGPKTKGVRYFGPYAHAWAIRETVDLLLRVFPVRTCSAGVFKTPPSIGRPCLLGYIGKCSAPCVGRVTAEEHRELAEEFCDFMAGRTGTYLRRLEKQMTEAAEEMEYERAARLRDDIEALKTAMEKNAVVLADATDADLIAVAEDELEAAVQIFHVRGGRVRGQRGWVTDKVEEITTGGPRRARPPAALRRGDGRRRPQGGPGPGPARPGRARRRSGSTERRGSGVSLRIPQRGDKKALMETVQRNAQQALVLHKTKRASDLTTRSRALEEIAEALDLDSAPLRIECYDISHLQGDDVVASMVVFEDGLPRKSEYRRFQIKGFEGQDDVRSMHEVITRRFRRYLAEKEKTGEWADGRTPVPEATVTETARPARRPEDDEAAPSGSPTRRSSSSSTAGSRRSPPPSGPWTSSVSTTSPSAAWPSAWRRSGCPARTTRSSCPAPARASTCSSGSGTRPTASRSPTSAPSAAKRFRSSPLDAVPGLGETRKQALLKHFGSVKRLRSATIDQICEVPGIGRKTAETIAAALAQAAPAAPAVNTATGEIMEDEEPATAEPGTVSAAPRTNQGRKRRARHAAHATRSTSAGRTRRTRASHAAGRTPETEHR